MSGIRYELRGERPAEGLIDALAEVHPRLGIAGLLRRRGRRAFAGGILAPAVTESFRWGPADGWSLRWWPQGVEVLSDRHDGDKLDELLVVSWFAQERRGSSQGARISVVDRRNPRRPRYHHVLLVEPTRSPDGDLGFAPVHIHAGGLAGVGDVLFAAATFGGLRRFDLRDILRVTGRAPFGYRCVLPQSGHEKLQGGEGDDRMRFSFVSVERSEEGGDEHLVVGEFGPHHDGRRLGRVRVGGVEVIELEEPKIPRMQGAALIHGTWFVSASNGLKPGDLWVGSRSDAASGSTSPTTWRRHRHVLPMGPEDLAVSTDGTRLWSLCEYPRHRGVYAMDATRWASEPGTSDPPEPQSRRPSP
ncbi:MAG: hypothetical protein ABJA11_07680 [Pseudolysinimonas sp.]